VGSCWPCALTRNWGNLRGPDLRGSALVRLQHRTASAFFLGRGRKRSWQKKNKRQLGEVHPRANWCTSSVGRNGDELHFDDSLPDIQRLGGIIQREDRLGAPVGADRADAFHGGADAGGSTRLRLNRDGIGHDQETIPWEKVQARSSSRKND